MDLEMTGLQPAHNVIVEIATIITDDDLNIVAEGPDLVVHATEEELALIEACRRHMVRILRSLPEAAFQRTGNHSEAGAQTLERLLTNVTGHIPHHIAFIREKRKALGI